MATQVTTQQLLAMAAATVGVLSWMSSCQDKAIEGTVNAIRVEMRAKDQAIDERVDLLERAKAQKASD